MFIELISVLFCACYILNFKYGKNDGRVYLIISAGTAVGWSCVILNFALTGQRKEILYYIFKKKKKILHVTQLVHSTFAA
jgi:hypothetical protein